MLRLLFVPLALFFLSQASFAEEKSALKVCERLAVHHEIDCACANSFLQTAYDAADVDIIMKILTFEADGRNHHDDLLSLYMGHGAPSISRAMINFRWLRPYLLEQCPAPGLHQEDQ